jgi:hypothetical protein
MRPVTDRLQALLRVVLLALLIIGGPAAATYAGHAAYVSGLESARAQSLAWHRVPAMILRVRPMALIRQRPAAAGPATLSVRWTTPQGSSRTGEIAGHADAAAGSLVPVWIDKAGRLTGPPLSRVGVVDRVTEAAAVTVAAIILLLSAINWSASQVLRRYRLARWEAEWLAVEPQWTKRR